MNEGQGVGPLTTVSSVEKGHTVGHVNDTVWGGYTADPDTERSI
jgi:hypothetical protein